MAFDLFGIYLGQSNQYSFTGYDISGAPGTNESASGADFGLKINSPFAAVLMNQMLNQAPAVPPALQTFGINTGDVALQNFAAAGQFNAGCEQAARLFVSLGIAANPYIVKCAIGSTSIVKHWGKLSGFPAGAAQTLYSQLITYLAARLVTAGRTPDYFVYRMGETASATPAEVTSAPTDNRDWFNNICDDLGITRNIPIIACYLNPHESAGDIAGYNAALDAWAAIDPRVSLIKVDDLFLRSDPHYAFNEQWKIGQRIVVEVWRRVRPTINISRGTGPLPYYQSAGPLCTSQGGTAPAVPHAGERPQAGNLDIAYALSYTAATTHTFTQPATGTPYTQLGTQVDSVLSTSHQGMTVWYRVLQASDIDSAGRTVGPTITFGTPTLNRAKRLIVPNVNPTTPIEAFLTGANNANSTALTIGAAATAVRAGCLALAIVGSAKSGGGQAVTALTSGTGNAGFTAPFTTIYDGEANPGAGIVHSAFGTAPISGTSLQPATVTFAQAGINVGFMLALNPILFGDSVGDLGATTGSSAGLLVVNGSASGDLGSTAGAAAGVVALAGAGSGDLGATAGAAVGSLALDCAAGGDLGSTTGAAAAIVVMIGNSGGDLGATEGSAIGTIAVPDPFTYCSVDDLVNAIGQANLIQLSDLDNRGIVDRQRVIAAILVGDGIINSYVGKRYAVPLSIVPQTINTLSIKWALRTLRERAFKVQPLQEDVDADKVDRAWLAGIAEGSISIGVDARPPKASDRIDVGAAPREGTRAMSLRRMKGFI